MATIADVQAQLNQLQATAQALLAAIQGQPPKVATQADVDALNAGLSSAQATLEQAKSAIPT